MEAVALKLDLGGRFTHDVCRYEGREFDAEGTA